MNLYKFGIGNNNELIDIENITIDTQEFYKIIEIVKSNLKKIGINPDGKNISYHRNYDATSILAIQVTPGFDNDINNYMINGCKAWKQDINVTCDVYMHSESKSTQKSMELANLINQDIVSFFEKTEKSLLNNNNFDASLSIIMSLDIKKEKPENVIKKLLRRIKK